MAKREEPHRRVISETRKGKAGVIVCFLSRASYSHGRWQSQRKDTSVIRPTTHLKDEAAKGRGPRGGKKEVGRTKTKVGPPEARKKREG